MVVVVMVMVVVMLVLMVVVVVVMVMLVMMLMIIVTTTLRSLNLILNNLSSTAMMYKAIHIIAHDIITDFWLSSHCTNHLYLHG